MESGWKDSLHNPTSSKPRKGIDNSQILRPDFGKIVVEIERYAKTAFFTLAFVSLYQTCYLAGIMILPPLSRDRFTNIAESSHLQKFEEQRYWDMFEPPANVFT